MRDLVAVSQVDRRISRIIGPVVDRMGYDLVRLRYGGGRRKTLQIMAERRGGGMEVDDCAEISRAVSSALDVEDPIREGYTLEVSSPGIDRPLTRLTDFETWSGHVAKLETAEPIEGRRRFQGRIERVSGNEIVLDSHDGPIGIQFEALSSAKLVITDELLKAAADDRKTRDGPSSDRAEIDQDEREMT